MLDPIDLNWYEANGHDIAIRLYEIVSFVLGSCFILVVLSRLHFTAPCRAASLDLPVGCSRLARGAGLSLALKCFASTGRREYPSCIYFVRSRSPLSTPYRYHGKIVERVYEYDAKKSYISACVALLVYILHEGYYCNREHGCR